MIYVVRIVKSTLHFMTKLGSPIALTAAIRFWKLMSSRWSHQFLRAHLAHPGTLHSFCIAEPPNQFDNQNCKRGQKTQNECQIASLKELIDAERPVHTGQPRTEIVMGTVIEFLNQDVDDQQCHTAGNQENHIIFPLPI